MKWKPGQSGSIEHQWKPGQSGNPDGRPHKSSLTKAYEKLIDSKVPGDSEGRTFAQVIALGMAMSAAKGNAAEAREINDRLEGKSVQQVQLTGGDGGPVELVGMTRAELLELDNRIENEVRALIPADPEAPA